MSCITYNKNSYIKISFTGDIMVEHTRLASFYVNNEYDFHSLFDSCKPLFQQSNYVIANLETPVAGKELDYSNKDYNFNTPETILKNIKDCGIDMVTTANNHVLDRGIVGIDKTIENIQKNGLDYTGTSPENNPQKPLIKKVDNIKIAFLSYTYGTEACYNLNYLKSCDQYRVNLLKNQELYNPIQRFLVRSNNLIAKVLRFCLRKLIPKYFKRSVEDFPQRDEYQKQHLINDINYCKENNVDYIVMCLHSGGQYNNQPTDYTIDISNFCFDNGVNLVVCNHEHVIQKALLYKNINRKIAYCLGNFSSNYGIERKPFDKCAQCSIVLHLLLNKDNKNCFRQKFSFSVVYCKKNKDGQIITVPLFDDYSSSKISDEKEKLINLNNEAVSRFIGKEINILPSKEYFIEDFEE